MQTPFRLKTLFLSALALLLIAGSALAAKTTLSPNPANDRSLVGTKLDPVRYDGADGCVKRAPKGMRQLVKWMKANTAKDTIYGTVRCDGGVHGTGRALDWMLDARVKKQKQQAMTVINTWLAKDKERNRNALARRMGIQLIIYNCRFWQAGDNDWSRYSACSGSKRNADPTQGHIDHIHVELTKKASKLKTSFWESDLGAGGEAEVEDGGISPAASRAASHDHEHPPLHPPEETALAEHLG